MSAAIHQHKLSALAYAMVERIENAEMTIHLPCISSRNKSFNSRSIVYSRYLSPKQMLPLCHPNADRPRLRISVRLSNAWQGLDRSVAAIHEKKRREMENKANFDTNDQMSCD